MHPISKPSKEAIRTWLGAAVVERRPPPSPERIREMLGWNLLETARKQTSPR
jgi:hypothetical protein